MRIPFCKKILHKKVKCVCVCENPNMSLQGIVIETILGRKNSVQGPLLLKLLFVSLKKMSPLIHQKEQGSSLVKFVNVLISLFNRIIL